MCAETLAGHLAQLDGNCKSNSMATNFGVALPRHRTRAPTSSTPSRRIRAAQQAVVHRAKGGRKAQEAVDVESDGE